MARRKSGNLQTLVRNEVLRAIRTNPDEVEKLSQGSIDFLANRASERILRQRNTSVSRSVEITGERFPEIVQLLKVQTDEVKQFGRGKILREREVRFQVQAGKICGIWPFC